MNNDDIYDDEKFEALVKKVEQLAADLGCSYAIPINELEDGTSEVYGVIIGDVNFIQSIMDTMNIENIETKEIPSTTSSTNKPDDDPTFH